MPSPREILKRQLTLTTHRIHTLPVVVLMPHSRCNCRCVMCDIWRGNRDRRELTREDLAPHVDSLRRLGVKRITLSGGEPLMHSGLAALCQMLRELDVHITLLSTGLLLARHADQVVADCDDVIVSLDGPREIHDEIRRVPRAFDQLAEGVAALRARAAGYPVTARCVVQRRNFRHLPEVIAAVRELELDSVSFLPADVTSEAFNRPGGWDSERASDVALDAPEAAELAERIEQLIAEHGDSIDGGLVVESRDKLRRLARHFAAGAGDGEPPPVRCNAPWVSTVIEANGDVRPCFFHPVMGNLGQGELDGILNAPAAIAFRRDLDVGRDPICRRCVCTLDLSPLQRI